MLNRSGVIIKGGASTLTFVGPSSLPDLQIFMNLGLRAKHGRVINLLSI